MSELMYNRALKQSGGEESKQETYFQKIKPQAATQVIDYTKEDILALHLLFLTEPCEGKLFKYGTYISIHAIFELKKNKYLNLYFKREDKNALRLIEILKR